MHFKLKMRFFTILVAGVVSSEIATAGFLSDAWGVITDPLKAGEASRNLASAAQRSLIHLERIQDKTDDDVTRYISEFDRIISETRKDVGNIAANTLSEIHTLEANFFKDTAQLVTCAPTEIGYQLREDFAKALNDAGSRKPRFEVFGIPLGSVQWDQKDIDNPIMQYRKLQQAHYSKLARVKPHDHPSSILDSYAELQRIAEKTRCFYNSDGNIFQELYYNEVELLRLEKPWTGKYKPL